VGRSDACDLVVPGNEVSRTHFLLTQRSDRWLLTDRSRHGTRVSGQALAGDHILKDGDAIELGSYRLVFQSGAEEDPDSTASVLDQGAPAEQLVAHDEDLSIQLPVLEVVGGPAEGFRAELCATQQSLGGPGSDIVIPDAKLLPAHTRLLLARGRPMILPGSGGVYLDGERVRGLVPIYPGERIRLGDSEFVLKSEVHRVVGEADQLGEMQTNNRAMAALFSNLRRMSNHTAPVLLVGESGTGKELAARALHTEGGSRSGQFVAINCGAVAESLFESELFGHEKGAFTDAREKRVGAFQQADGGTLFLDEIGELPLPAQAKLLRTLESGEVRPVGSTRVYFPEVRVIAATNRNLHAEVESGRFRKDLFFRLAVLCVRLPPLRERIEDLPLLATALCERLSPQASLAPEALVRLQAHRFPGNIRELRNILTRAFVLGGPRIEANSIQVNPWEVPTTQRPAKDLLEDTEKQLLLDSLRRHDGNRSAVARELGIARSTLHYKIRRFELQTEPRH
jgi:transcriptional regulator with AAA-type ATPase domain